MYEYDPDGFVKFAGEFDPDTCNPGHFDIMNDAGRPPIPWYPSHQVRMMSGPRGTNVDMLYGTNNGAVPGADKVYEALLAR